MKKIMACVVGLGMALAGTSAIAQAADTHQAFQTPASGAYMMMARGPVIKQVPSALPNPMPRVANPKALPGDPKALPGDPAPRLKKPAALPNPMPKPSALPNPMPSPPVK